MYYLESEAKLRSFDASDPALPPSIWETEWM